MRLFYLLLFGVIGTVFILIAVFGSEWFLRYARTRPILGAFGKNGARVLTGIIGALLVAYGIAYFAGII